MITAQQLADLMDECADESGQWEGADVCQALADLIDRHDGWKRCPEHGVFSASKDTCPFQHYDIQWSQPDDRDNGRDDACWYAGGDGHSLVAHVSFGDHTVGVYVDGDMDIRAYRLLDGDIEEVGCARYAGGLLGFGIHTDADVIALTPHDDDPNLYGATPEGYYLDFVHTPWYDIYDDDGNHLDRVCHSLNEAIITAMRIVNP